MNHNSRNSSTYPGISCNHHVLCSPASNGTQEFFSNSAWATPFMEDNTVKEIHRLQYETEYRQSLCDSRHGELVFYIPCLFVQGGVAAFSAAAVLDAKYLGSYQKVDNHASTFLTNMKGRRTIATAWRQRSQGFIEDVSHMHRCSRFFLTELGADLVGEFGQGKADNLW
jgi:hypothetical protein